MRRFFCGAAFACAATLLPYTAMAAEALRIATLKTGTVAWEIDTILHYGLDKKHGLALTLVPVAGKQGADVMLQGGETDVIVTDWIWVSRQRSQGADYTFFPYSKSVGGILVNGSSHIASLADLKGKKIGVAGGPTDKSWILFQAVAKKEHGIDLAKDAEPVFAAPPLITETLNSGEIDAAITFWHFGAKLKANGAKEIASVADAAKALGLDAETPLLGYVYSEKFAKDHPGAMKGLAAASKEAKAMLASDPEAFNRLREIMNAKTDAEFEALKTGFLAGAPGNTPVDPKAAEAVFALLAEIGGKELAGDSPTLAPGTFATPE
jgi:NitT/TauT family transport system substrate-binding protein